MGRTARTARRLLPWLALVSLLSSCQSAPTTNVVIDSHSSLLAVDVVFPEPLSRDPDLVQVFFVNGPIHAGLAELPDLVPATFVKWDRAYLLDPDPGTYSVVAVTAAYAPPWNEYRIVGVTKTTWSRTSSDAIIFPEELIRRTRTTIGQGDVAYMGTLHVRRGDRIDANTVFEDDLQRRLARNLRPGVASKSGFSGWLERTRMVNLEKTSLSNEIADRKSFFDEAPTDLGDSPWAGFVARAAPREAAAVKPRARAPGPKHVARVPEAAAATPPHAARETEAASTEPPPAPMEPERVTVGSVPAPTAPAAPSAPPPREPAEFDAATDEPSPELAEPIAVREEFASAPVDEPVTSPPSPEPKHFPDLPPDSRLAEIEYGMRHYEVREILGPPDGRMDRMTAKAWIPFYTGRGANLRDWIYEGTGRVVFSLYQGKLEVIDVVYDPDERK